MGLLSAQIRLKRYHIPLVNRCNSSRWFQTPNSRKITDLTTKKCTRIENSWIDLPWIVKIWAAQQFLWALVKVRTAQKIWVFILRGLRLEVWAQTLARNLLAVWTTVQCQVVLEPIPPWRLERVHIWVVWGDRIRIKVWLVVDLRIEELKRVFRRKREETKDLLITTSRIMVAEAPKYLPKRIACWQMLITKISWRQV